MKHQFRRRSDVAAVLPIVRRQFEAGRVIAYPTETLYGLGAALTDQGLDAIDTLKGREEGKPCLVLVASRTMLEAWGFDVPAHLERMIQAFWPGPLTLILPNRDLRFPRRLRGRSAGVAVRWTSHATAAGLVEALGHPLVSTSANPAGRPPATDADQVAAWFPEAVLARQLEILDGGHLVTALPSTLIDGTGDTPVMLREGAITRDQLREYLPE